MAHKGLFAKASRMPTPDTMGAHRGSVPAQVVSTHLVGGSLAVTLGGRRASYARSTRFDSARSDHAGQFTWG